MTTRTRYYIAIAVCIAAISLFFISTFTPVLSGFKKLDFLQGFSGGLGFGSFLAVLTFGTKLRREKQERLA